MLDHHIVDRDDRENLMIERNLYLRYLITVHMIEWVQWLSENTCYGLVKTHYYGLVKTHAMA